MKRILAGTWLLSNKLQLFLLLSFLFLTQEIVIASIAPDSVYLFSYTTTKNSNKNGLHFAWSNDRSTWFAIGNEYGFLKSDYGRWGSEKRMYDPIELAAYSFTMIRIKTQKE